MFILKYFFVVIVFSSNAVFAIRNLILYYDEPTNLGVGVLSLSVSICLIPVVVKMCKEYYKNI